MRYRGFALFIVVVHVCACGARQLRGGSFPAREALAELGSTPATNEMFGDDSRDPETFTLEGPLADAYDLVELVPRTPWDQALAAAARKRPGALVLTESMHCVAREIGRFYLAEKTRPAWSVVDFIAARCGVPYGGVGLQILSADVPAEASEQELFQRLEPRFSSLVGSLHGNRVVGAWFGTGGGHGVMVLTNAERSVHLARVPVHPVVGSDVLLEGEVYTSAAVIRAVANHGEFGTAECPSDPAVPLPRFRFRCALSPDDASTWIEIGVIPPGRVLGKTVVSLLIFPRGDASSTYVRLKPLAAPAPSGDPTRDFVGAINALRARAGLRTVTLAERESVTASRVAPHYFAAAFGRLPETVVDVVSLGLMAGWDVDGLVQRGRFTSGTSATNDPGRLLADMLHRPTSRDALFEPNVSQLAIGYVKPASGGPLAAIVTTYVLLEQEHLIGQARTVLQKVNESRSRKGLPPAVSSGQLAGHAASAAMKVQSAHAEPREAIQDMVASGSQALQRTVFGFVLESMSLEDLAVPPELIERSSLALGVAVAWYRPPGEPWARYIVIILATEGSANRTAATRKRAPAHAASPASFMRPDCTSSDPAVPGADLWAKRW